MTISEFDIEEIIYNAIKDGKISELNSRGLLIPTHAKYYRQLFLGNYGKLDLLGVQFQEFERIKTVAFSIIEIKKGEINFDVLKQALRYCKGLESLIVSNYFGINYEFYITLIGGSVTQSDFCYLPDFMKNLSIYTIDIDLLKGFTFDLVMDFGLTEPGNLPKHINVLGEYKEIYKKFINLQR